MRRRRVLVPVVAVLLSAILAGLGQLLGSQLWTWASIALLAIQAVIEAWLVVEGARRRRLAKLPSIVLPAGLVHRPEKAAEVVGLLTDWRAEQPRIASVVALTGSGGFGKSCLAELVCADPRILKAFPGGSLLLSIGQGVRGPGLATKINEMMQSLVEEHSGYTDPVLAGKDLMELLNTGPRRLLVVDDVWSTEQLTPFQTDGSRCAVLVTTRVPNVLPAGARSVLVDEMSLAEARQLVISRGVALKGSVLDDLIRTTGQWPLMLGLVSSRVRKMVDERGAEVAARMAIEQITTYGPAVLDVRIGADRTNAISVSIGLSLNLLTIAGGAERFAELGIFSSNARIPISNIAQLWAATAGLNEPDSYTLCRELDELSLARFHGPGALELHSVIRAQLRTKIAARIPGVQAVWLDSVAATLPRADVLDPDGQPVVAWWELPPHETYLWDNLAQHLAEAARSSEMDKTIGDLRWISARLVCSGTAATLADLSHFSTERSANLTRELMRIAHLLNPTTPTRCVVDVMLSRLRDDTMWHDEVQQMLTTITTPHLINRWPLPDVPDEFLRRVLAGHTGWVTSLAIFADGQRIASGGHGGTIELWDSVNGRLSSKLTANATGTTVLAVSPDGTWLASTDGRTTVYIWDLTTETLRISFDAARSDLDRQLGWVTTLSISPDSQWVAAANLSGNVGQWDATTGKPRTPHAGGWIAVHSVEYTPDGRWLVTACAGDGKLVNIWDTATGELDHSFSVDHTDEIRGLAISPDGTWIATVGGNYDKRVQLTNLSTGEHLHSIVTGHSGVASLAISPDGSWIATCAGMVDDTIQFWDTTSGESLGTLGGISLGVMSIAISPDGAWLAAGDQDGSVRIWDLNATQQNDRIHGGGLGGPVAFSRDGTWLTGTGDNHREVRIWNTFTGRQQYTYRCPCWHIATSPDGKWLATAASTDHVVRIWRSNTSQLHIALPAHDGSITSIAMSHNGRRFAVGDTEGTVRTWDMDTWQTCATFAVHQGWAPSAGVTNKVTSLVVSPDGTWLATTAHLDRHVILSETATGTHRHTLHSDSPVEVIAIAPDSSWLATGDWDGLLRIWDATNGNIRAAITAMADSSDRIPSKQQTEIEDLVVTLEGRARTAKVESVTISPDGRWLATTVHDDPTVRIWDSARGHRLTTLRVGADEDDIRSVAVSADGAWLATTSGGAVSSHVHTLMVWNTATWDCIASTRVNGRVDGCTWSPDGQSIAMTGTWGVYVFEFCTSPTPQAIDQAKHHTSPALHGVTDQWTSNLSSVARDLMLPLIYAQDLGLSTDDLWPLMATALSGRPYTVAEVQQLVETTRYLVESKDEAGRPIFRLADQAHIAHLRANRDRIADQTAIVEVLISQVGRTKDGQIDWDRAHPYIRRNLATHAAETDRLDSLLVDPRFLLAAEPEALIAALPVAATSRACAAGAAYRQALARIRVGHRSERAAYLQLAARGAGAQHLAEAINACGLAPSWRTDWATYRLDTPHHAVSAHANTIYSIVLANVNGRMLMISAGADRRIHVNDPITGAPVGDPITGHTSWINSVAVGQIGDRSFIVSGAGDHAVRVWDPATGNMSGDPYIGHTDEVRSVAIGVVADQTVIVSGSDDGTIRMWDALTDAQIGEPYIGHTGGVTAVTLGRVNDKDVVVSGGEDGTVRIWDAVSARDPLGEPLIGHKGGIRSITIGEVAGMTVVISGGNDQTIRIWDAAGGSVVGQPITGHRGQVRSVAIGTVAERTVVVSGGGDAVRVWNLINETLLADPYVAQRRGSVNAVALATVDGRAIIASGGDDHVLRIWDPTVAVSGLDLYRGAESVAVGEVGGQAVIVTGGNDRTVRLWDAVTQMPVGSSPYLGHDGTVELVAIGSADGRAIVASCGGGSILVWDPHVGAQIGMLEHYGPASSVAFGQIDGRLVAVSRLRDFTIQVRDVATGAAVFEPFVIEKYLGSSVAAVGALNGRTTIAYSHGYGGIRLWDVATGLAVSEPYRNATGHVNEAAFGHIHEQTILILGHSDGTVCTWNPAKAAPIGDPFQDSTTDVTALAFGQIRGRPVVAAGCHDWTVRLWDSITGESIGQPYRGNQVRSIAVGEIDQLPVITYVSTDNKVWIRDADTGDLINDPGRTRGVAAVASGEMSGRAIVASGGNDETVRLLDALTGSAIGEPFAGQGTWINAVAIGQMDSRTIVVVSHGGDSHKLWAYDAATGTPIGGPLIGHTDTVTSAAIGQLDGRPIIISGGGDRVVRIWDAATGTPLGSPYAGHTDWITSLAVGKIGDRTIIVSGSEDRRVIVWDASTGQRIRDPYSDLAYVGYPGGANAVAVAQVAGRSVLVTGGRDKTIRLWDAVTSDPIGDPCIGHTDAITAVAWGQTADRTVLVSGSNDHTVRVWNIESRTKGKRTHNVSVSPALLAVDFESPILGLALTSHAQVVVATDRGIASLRFWPC